jgi:hypothetical protein
MKVAIDFGTCLTKLAIPNGDLVPPGSFDSFAATVSSSGGTLFSAVPSRVLPSAAGPLAIGCELADSGPDAVGWMKHFLLQESPVTLRSGGMALNYREAASAFLEELLRRLAAISPDGTLDAVFTVQHDAPPSYYRWLTALAGRSPAGRFALLDEVACMIAGSGLSLSGNGCFLLVDAGGAALKSSLAVSGEPCRIIGAAAGDAADAVSCRERLLPALHRTLAAAAARGFSEENITAVVISGGCGASLRDPVAQLFPGIPVHTEDPLFTAVRGALLLGSGAAAPCSLSSDYAVRFWNSTAGTYEYRTLVPRGSLCPSPGPVARFRIRGAYDGQTQLSVPLFEVRVEEGGGSGMELVGERGGGIRLVRSGSGTEGGVSYRPVSTDALFLIPADPPVTSGETRFEVVLSLDAAMGLRATVRDVQAGRLVVKDGLVARLA